MENKVVLVTGSARGIGKATIIEFASKGYNVVINYIESKEEANKLKEYVESNFNIKALVIEADVSNENAVKNMIDNIIKEFGEFVNTPLQKELDMIEILMKLLLMNLKELWK